MTKPTASFQSSSFVIAVRDLKKSSAYFCDVLGFDLAWAGNSPLGDACVSC
ncbi:VOC family protein [Serratia fonticola]|uniref:VOC family protein n=2 Tax=Serratia TaxID=613 RepID=UPI00351BB296